jgi:hypothetical protein
LQENFHPCLGSDLGVATELNPSFSRNSSCLEWAISGQGALFKVGENGHKRSFRKGNKAFKKAAILLGWLFVDQSQPSDDRGGILEWLYTLDSGAAAWL